MRLTWRCHNSLPASLVSMWLVQAAKGTYTAEEEPVMGSIELTFLPDARRKLFVLCCATDSQCYSC